MTKVLQSYKNAGWTHTDGQTINKTTPHIPLTDIENLAKQVSGGNHCLCAPASGSGVPRWGKNCPTGLPEQPEKGPFPVGADYFARNPANFPKIIRFE
jgi:hypothetical protein